MARIAGVDLPPNKRLWIGLTAIYGIGQARARSLAEKAKVDYFKKMAAELGMPYQNLINLFLRDCAMQKRRPTIQWPTDTAKPPAGR